MLSNMSDIIVKNVPATVTVVALSILTFWLLQVGVDAWMSGSFDMTLGVLVLELLLAGAAVAIVYWLLAKGPLKSFVKVQYELVPIDG